MVNIYYCNINPRIIGHTSSSTDHCVFSWIMDIMFKYKINDAKFDWVLHMRTINWDVIVSLQECFQMLICWVEMLFAWDMWSHCYTYEPTQIHVQTNTCTICTMLIKTFHILGTCTHASKSSYIQTDVYGYMHMALNPARVWKASAGFGDKCRENPSLTINNMLPCLSY